MSQIALAYTVSSELLDQLSARVSANDYKRFWDLIKSEATEVAPAYDYSGYVVMVFNEYLQEQGLALPMHSTPATEPLLKEQELGLLAIAQRTDAASVLERLDHLGVSEEELKEYLEDFSGEKGDEAGPAMMGAFDFIRRGFQQLQNSDGWLLLLVV